ncbi:hypothetical protein HMPREF3230_01283 [Gardnerella vaginalis]|uniref:Uncharacterized protein n=1 Tax=Gardnerella vaginalis TaxID=2702 RepID=A0A135Z273_GARVA|nr:hypothetical protein HMPREF3230_01283 [Gardnerella vaginalis]
MSTTTSSCLILLLKTRIALFKGQRQCDTKSSKQNIYLKTQHTQEVKNKRNNNNS